VWPFGRGATSAVQKRKGKKEREGARVCRATLLYCDASAKKDSTELSPWRDSVNTARRGFGNESGIEGWGATSDLKSTDGGWAKRPSGAGGAVLTGPKLPEVDGRTTKPGPYCRRTHQPNHRDYRRLRRGLADDGGDRGLCILREIEPYRLESGGDSRSAPRAVTDEEPGVLKKRCESRGPRVTAGPPAHEQSGGQAASAGDVRGEDCEAKIRPRERFAGGGVKRRAGEAVSEIVAVDGGPQGTAQGVQGRKGGGGGGGHRGGDSSVLLDHRANMVAWDRFAM